MTALEAIKSNCLLSAIALAIGYAGMAFLIVSDDMDVAGRIGYQFPDIVLVLMFVGAFALYAFAAGAIAELAESWLPPPGTTLKALAGWFYVIALGALLCVPQAAMNAYKEQKGPSAPLALLALPAPVPQRYTTEVYVNLYPEESLSKNYRLPATIRVDQLGAVKTHRIEKAYWPNGGWLTFQVEDQPAQGLELNKQVALTDTHGKRWRVEITDQPSAAIHP